MRLSIKTLILATSASAVISGCLVVPEPVEEPVIEVPVVVEVPTAPLCYEVSALQMIEIPAETKTVVGISLIENPPYAPIEQRTSQVIVMKQAEVFYVVTDTESGSQTEVTNFCDETVETGPVGPAPGEALGAPIPG